MKNRVWRKKGEGPKFTVKGSKNLADGHWLHLIVAMAYGKYVVLKEAYEKLKGPIITKYIQDILHCVCRIWAKKKRERTFLSWIMIPVNGVRSQRGPLRTSRQICMRYTSMIQ